MKNILSSIALAAVLVGGVAVVPAWAGPASKVSTVSCEVFQKGGVKSRTQVNTYGYAPGGKQFSYNWGAWSWRTYRVNGTQKGGGWWSVETNGIMDTNSTYGYCYGG